MTIRKSARVLLLDGHNRLLLFQLEYPILKPFWVTPGGRLEEIRASTEIFVPKDLVRLLPPLLTGDFPKTPLLIR
ncbi:hypothetical protein ACFQ49_01950 [Kroppenstedtia eburnea]|uniref:Nudix hydrolase domain-containing protein n=1 Tax=Kroppenstedtia eburnea TaxID=714067 RepID=A0A1N7KU48_9BACL|nr:hypothetical protein [Kroppenstedtia eburnea]QKI82808.1 hypothetical protein GXN75_12835 [Kroppenstedtia eburnea]SIS65133.1 hypothetical protein SAMN05421790_103272 [Kroppenstedtia eburnea]